VQDDAANETTRGRGVSVRTDDRGRERRPRVVPVENRAPRRWRVAAAESGGIDRLPVKRARTLARVFVGLRPRRLSGMHCKDRASKSWGKVAGISPDYDRKSESRTRNWTISLRSRSSRVRDESDRFANWRIAKLGCSLRGRDGLRTLHRSRRHACEDSVA
jgi:hypothetical protein